MCFWDIKISTTQDTPPLTCLWFPWRSASSAHRSGNLAAGQMTAGGWRVAPGWSSPTGGSQSRSERRIFPCTWSWERKKYRVRDDTSSETCSWSVKMKSLTDSKAMDSQRTFPPCIPTAPWESCPGSRLGSGREWQSGWSRGRIEDSLLPGENRGNNKTQPFQHFYPLCMICFSYSFVDLSHSFLFRI